MSVSVKLYCKKSKVKPDGTAPIYLVLRINSKDKLILTGKYLDPNLFDNDTGKAKRGTPDMLKLNAYLGAKLAQMEKIILDFQHQGRAITHEHIINAYHADGNVLFVDFSRKELEDAKGTIGANYYDTIRYQLEKLDKFHPNLTFQQLDYNFLQKYAYYLTAKGNKPNTMKSDFVMIRKEMEQVVL